MTDHQPLTDVPDLTGQVIKTEEFYFTSGGFSEVFKGVLTNPHREAGRRVAIKVLRVVGPDAVKQIQKILQREPRVWDYVEHANILPLLGYSTDLARSHALISPLCKEGHVTQYLAKYPGADRAKIISQIAKGLEYLHAQNIVHGDMKCNNVLISDDGRPLICDFGRSKILEQHGFTTKTVAGSTRTMAPELFPNPVLSLDAIDSFVPILTKQSDVYAFGMVGLEILTDQIPFCRTHDTALTLRIGGGLPTHHYICPPEYTGTWGVIESCWKIDPQERPTMVDVVRRLPSSRRG